MKNVTYQAPEVVRVTEDTEKFIRETKELAEKAESLSNEINSAKTNQALFEMGALDFLKSTVQYKLQENSLAYFHGNDFGRRLSETISSEAKKRFPSPFYSEKVKEHGEALFKQQLEIQKIQNGKF